MSGFSTLSSLLGIECPVIQAPMAGISTPELAAAVSEAGGLGSLGLGASNLQQAAQAIRQTRRLTTRPFNVNLFCHAPAHPDPGRESAWLAHLATEFHRFGAEPPARLHEIYRSALGNDALLALLLQERPAVVSFHFGLPAPQWIAALRSAGCITMATATAVAEAEQVQAAGIDVVIAQGIEAGGHRGIFDAAQDPALGTLALLDLLATRIRLPVVAAGGIMDGAGIAAALLHGAAAAQMGTAFVLCPESAASMAYRDALKSERARHTAITRTISGRPARSIINRLHALHNDIAPPVPDYPIAYAAAKALHEVASAHNCHDYAAHWAGQGAADARELPAAELVHVLVREWRASELGGHAITQRPPASLV